MTDGIVGDETTTDDASEQRWPASLRLADMRRIKPLDYEVVDLLTRHRGSRMLWNTEQGVWYTFTPERLTDGAARRWVPNGEHGELAQNQVNLFAREMIDLIDDRTMAIDMRTRQLQEMENPQEGVDGEIRRLELERADLQVKRKLVETQKARVNLTSIMRTEPSQHVSLNELDGDSHLLNFLNGTYDVRTGELRPHQPSDRITHLIPHKLHLDMIGKPLSDTAPKFWMMLWRAASAGGERPQREHEELVAAMMRWLGYNLHGSNPEKMIAIWKGASNIGKTQIVEICCRLLGAQLAWPTASNKLITVAGGDRHDAVTSPLAGRRVVLINELHRNQHLDEHMVLQLVNPEGGGMELRRMRKDSFSTRITWKITATTNDLPQSELPPQVQNRLMILQLSEVSIPKNQLNKSLTQEILGEESEAIIAALVTEWRAWWLTMRDSQEREDENSTGLVIPRSVAANIESYRDANKPLHALFLDERCEIDPAHVYRVAPAVLWRHCEAYMEDQHSNVDRKRRPGRNEFFAYMDTLPGIRVEMKGRGSRAPQRIWFHGVKLLEPDPGSKEQYLEWQETYSRMMRDRSIAEDEER